MATSYRLGKIPRSGFGPGKGISTKFRANEWLRLSDEVLGFWSNEFYRAVAEANEAMAIKVQEGMVEKLRAGVGRLGRPQRGGERLAMSLMHEENRLVTSSGFLVGREAWLNQSPARMYWRGIESGIGSYYTKALFFGPESEYTWSKMNRKGEVVEYTTEYVPPMRSMYRMNERMPQHRGFDVRISAFAGHNYMSGGREAFERLQPYDFYDRAFSQYGMRLQPNQKRKVS